MLRHSQMNVDLVGQVGGIMCFILLFVAPWLGSIECVSCTDDVVVLLVLGFVKSRDLFLVPVNQFTELFSVYVFQMIFACEKFSYLLFAFWA